MEKEEEHIRREDNNNNNKLPLHRANTSRGIKIIRRKTLEVKDDNKRRTHKIFLLKFRDHFSVIVAGQFFRSELLNKFSTFVHTPLCEYTA